MGPHSIMLANEKNIKKAKGVKKCVVKKELKHEQYKQTLFEGKQMRHGMNILRNNITYTVFIYYNLMATYKIQLKREKCHKDSP